MRVTDRWVISAKVRRGSNWVTLHADATQAEVLQEVQSFLDQKATKIKVVAPR